MPQSIWLAAIIKYAHLPEDCATRRNQTQGECGTWSLNQNHEKNAEMGQLNMFAKSVGRTARLTTTLLPITRDVKNDSVSPKHALRPQHFDSRSFGILRVKCWVNTGEDWRADTKLDDYVVCT